MRGDVDCVGVRTCVRTYVHTNIHTYMTLIGDPNIHTYMTLIGDPITIGPAGEGGNPYLNRSR